MPTFDDLKPWPETAERHHNQPPLEVRITDDFDQALEQRGLFARIAEIIANADKAPDAIRNPEDAGKAADLCVMARTAKEQVEAERELLNRPLLVSQRALKSKADSTVQPMDDSIAVLKAKLDAFVDATGEKVTGDYGAKVSSRTDWLFEVVDFQKLPLAIRRHPTVLEAIDKVVRAQVRGGARAIPGVNIWSETKAAIR
jgi:hypothetical protein